MIEHDHGGFLEICVGSPGDVESAVIGGADRVELCGALEIGGLTPSAGLVNAARAIVRGTDVALFAMVRPRSGDFAYDEAELTLAITEARTLIAQGVDGLVFGAVRDACIDRAAARAWIAAVRALAPRLPCTFHRAIDTTADPVAAVATIAALGFDTVLTSGGAARAIDGAATIRGMVASAGPVRIMAGSGVTPETAASLLATTGVSALHASASTPVAVGVDPKLVELGFAIAPVRRTDVETVRALRSVLDNSAPIRH